MPNPTLITEWSLLRWLLNNASKALNTKAPWQYLVFWRYLYQGQPVSVNRTQTAAILKGSRVMHSVLVLLGLKCIICVTSYFAELQAENF